MSYTVTASNAGSPFAGNGDATCSGSGDQSVINAAISLVSGLGGGTVELSDGNFSINAPIVMASNVTLQGQGSEATHIVRTGSQTMVQMNGSDSDHHIHAARMFDLRLNGGDTAATGVEMHYCDTSMIHRVHFFGIYANAIEAAECWDSSFTDCRFDYCGSRTAAPGLGKPAIGLYSTLPGVPSDNNCNQLHFVNCVVETFADGAIGIFGQTAAGRVNNCSFTNCHIESKTLRGTPIQVVFGTFINFRNIFIAMGAFENQNQPQDAFVISSSYNIVIDGYFGAPIAGVASPTVRTLLKLSGGAEDNKNIHLESVMFDTTPTNFPTLAALEFVGLNKEISMGFVGFGFDGAGNTALQSGAATTKVHGSLVLLPTPHRVYDSRPGQPNAGGSVQGILTFGAPPRTINCSRDSTPPGPVVVPTNASAILFNLAVTNTVNTGALAVYETGQPQPLLASSINWFGPNQIISNAVTSACNSQRQVNVAIVAGVLGTSATHFILDVIGYYP